MLGFPKKRVQLGAEGTPILVTVDSGRQAVEVSVDESEERPEEQPQNLFQLFLQEQRAIDPEIDTTAALRIWNDMPEAERRSYGESRKELLPERDLESEKGAKKVQAVKKARISRIAFGNIVKLDPELAGVTGKEAAECLMSAIDSFAAEIIKGSEIESRKKNLKKKALKAEHLFAYMSQHNYRYWFAKDVREDYRKAKEAKKRQATQKRTDMILPKTTEPQQTQHGGSKPITAFFGVRKDKD
jgi:hypothetical protein